MNPPEGRSLIYQNEMWYGFKLSSLGSLKRQEGGTLILAAAWLTHPFDSAGLLLLRSFSIVSINRWASSHFAPLRILLVLPLHLLDDVFHVYVSPLTSFKPVLLSANEGDAKSLSGGGPFFTLSSLYPPLVITPSIHAPVLIPGGGVLLRMFL